MLCFDVIFIKVVIFFCYVVKRIYLYYGCKNILCEFFKFVVYEFFNIVYFLLFLLLFYLFIYFLRYFFIEVRY